MRTKPTLMTSLYMFLGIFILCSCAPNARRVEMEQRGMFSQKMKISTLPTSATIYINEEEIGTSPLTYRISHEDSRMLNIRAVPLYPNQYTQNIFLMVPPIPKTMTIYMNHYPEDYDRNKEKEFTPPEKPEPQVIVESRVDTVYVDKPILESVILNLPVVYFDTDKYDLRASDIPKLNELVKTLNLYSDYSLDILGFADPRASERHNLELSVNRAKAVKDFLLAAGIEESRLTVYGHGKVSKVSSEGVEADLAESRKVMFILKERL